MTYTNPLNWVALAPGDDAGADYRLPSTDAEIEARTLITKTRRTSGSWKVEVSVIGVGTRDGIFQDGLRMDLFVRRMLKDAGMSEAQIATFEIPMDEPELLSVEEEEPEDGSITYIYDPDELDVLLAELPVEWLTNRYGSRTLVVRPKDAHVGLTVVAIEIPLSEAWEVVVRTPGDEEYRDEYTGTSAQAARVMRRLYIRRTI